jgi:hypothetical protein
MFVVDSMHNVWEGLFRDLLGKLMNRPDGMELWADDETEGDTSGEEGGEGDGMSEGDVDEGGDGDDVGTKRLKGWEELLKRWRFPRNVGPMMGKIGHKLSKLKVRHAHRCISRSRTLSTYVVSYSHSRRAQS